MKLKELSLQLKQLENKTLTVGWLGGNTYPNGQSVASVAIIQEYGTGKIPPRPFMRPAIAKNSDKWIKTGVNAILKGGLKTKQALEVLGLVIQGDIQQAIEDVQSPPLAPSTIKARQAKGNTRVKPLIDTSLMIKSVTYNVE